MTVSGEVEQPAAPAVPEGFVLVKQTEHDAAQGDLRRTRKELATRKEADEARERQDRADAAKAAGDFDTALGEERSITATANARASKAELGDAIVDVLLSREYTGEQATAIKQLVDRESVELDSNGVPVPFSVTEAVDSVVKRFPNLFNPEKPAAPATDTRAPRRAGPATPPPESEGAKPEGFISQEEYTNTPRAIRYTDAFRARVAISEPFWPKHIHQADLHQDPS